MKAAVIVSLQVALMLLPVIGGTIPGMNELMRLMMSGKESADSKLMDKDGTIAVVPINTKTVCWGPTPTCLEMDFNARVFVKNGHRSKICYRDIRIVETPECTALQPIDFSGLRISDFCIGDNAELDGLINFVVGMSMPSTINATVTRIDEDLRYYSRNYGYFLRKEVKDRTVLILDGCRIMDRIMCPRTPLRWCGCPIREGVLVLDRNEIPMAHDMLSNDMEYGLFNARVTVTTPEGVSCTNIAFRRVPVYLDFNDER